MKFLVDSSEFPIIFITYPEKTENSEIDAYADKLDALMQRAHIATVIDVRAVSVMDAGAAQRQYLAKQVDRVTQKHPGALISEAVIFKGRLLRAAYTAFQWVKKDSSYQSRAFETVDEAKVWSEEQVKAAL